MPAFSTHYLFYKQLKNQLLEKCNFEFNKEACSLGTQGPDIFFFTSSFKLIKIGNAIHKSSPEKIFDSLIEYLNYSGNTDIAKSYIYGFILHYSLDRICHPYVYAHQEMMVSRNPKLNPSTAHNTIEYAMDTYLLHEYFNIDDVTKFDMASTMSTNHVILEEISHLLSFVIERVTDFYINEKDLEKLFISGRKKQKILKNKFGLTTLLAKIMNIFISPFINGLKFTSMLKPKSIEKSIKYANINNKTWHSPYEKDRDRNESFIDLFETSKSDALYLIDGFNELLNSNTTSYELTKNISFLTGIELEENK